MLVATGIQPLRGLPVILIPATYSAAHEEAVDSPGTFGLAATTQTHIYAKASRADGARGNGAWPCQALFVGKGGRWQECPDGPTSG